MTSSIAQSGSPGCLARRTRSSLAGTRPRRCRPTVGESRERPFLGGSGVLAEHLVADDFTLSTPASDAFVRRHIGPSPTHVAEMLSSLGLRSLEELIDRCVPQSIRGSAPLALPRALGEAEQLSQLAGLAAKNAIYRSYIGLGYYDCVTPAVIQRNILENPGWYTQYTPYQAEIAQGRLEAMTMCHHAVRQKKTRFFVDADCHPQTLAVLQTRAEPLGIEIVSGPARALSFDDPQLFGVLVSYPGSSGSIHDFG